MSDQTTTPQPEAEQAGIDTDSFGLAEVMQATGENFRIRYQELTTGITEPGGVAYMTIYWRGAPANITARANDPFTCTMGLFKAVTLVDKALPDEITLKIPQPPPAAPPAPNAAAEAVRSENPKLANQIEQQTLALPDPPAGKVWQPLICDRIQITPEPDDKVTIKFFAPGHKYPDLYANKWTQARAKELLAPVTSESVSEAKIVTVKCTVYWTEGREYPNAKTGKPDHYKDVGAVRPAN